MFTIQDGRKQFYQWDIDRKLVVNDSTINEVHFSSDTKNVGLVVNVVEEKGTRVAAVPNILLQDGIVLSAYGYDTNHTLYKEEFDILQREKPSDYIYTETELVGLDKFKKDLKNLQTEKVDKKDMAAALAKKVDNSELENYYTKTEIDNMGTGGTGTNGKDGLSAYEIAVKNGYKGTEQEWLLSLKGAKGDKGDKGEKGVKGDKGENGLDGRDGTNGVNGKDGINGTNGTDGKDGKTPVKGIDYFTEQDKQELISSVMAALPSSEGGKY